ncbi:MAG: DUF4058 family protein, partial [Gemmataceae bacterium]
EEELVTTIEILSPTNKRPGEHGRDLYVRKQRQILDSRVHLVEIDLLRAGTHSTAVPEGWMRAKVPPCDYHVCIHHFDNLEDYFVYPVSLPGRLPVIAVPLLPGDAPVLVDLQAVLQRTYEMGTYRRRVRYTAPVPAPELSPERREWVKKLLTDKKLLPAP